MGNTIAGAGVSGSGSYRIQVNEQRTSAPAAPVTSDETSADSARLDEFIKDEQALTAKVSGADPRLLDQNALAAESNKAGERVWDARSTVDKADTRLSGAEKKLDALGEAKPTESAAKLKSERERISGERAAAEQAGVDAAAQLTSLQQQRTAVVSETAGAQKVIDKKDPNGQLANIVRGRDQNPYLTSDRDKTESAQKKDDLKQVRAAQQTVNAAGPRLEALDRQITAARANVDRANDGVAAADAKLPGLDAKIEYATAKENANGLRSQLSQLRGVKQSFDDTVAVKIGDRKAVREAGELVGRADQSIHEMGQNFVRGERVQLARAQSAQAVVDKMIDNRESVPSDVNVDKIQNDIKVYGEAIDGVTRKREMSAQQLVWKLEDPAFNKTLERMPDDARADLVGKMVKGLAGTKCGDAYLQKNLVPVLEGKKAEKAEGPESPNALASFFQSGKTAQDGALAVLEGAGAFLASKPTKEANRLLDGGMRQALGLNPGEVKTVMSAMAKKAAGDGEGAKELLEHSKLGKLGKTLERYAAPLTAINASIAIMEAAEHPEDMAKVTEAVKGGMELAEAVAKFAPKSLEGLAKFGELAGKAAKPLDLVLGAVKMYGSDGSAARGDMGASWGNALTMAGGVMETAGFLLDASIVGAPLGVFLNIGGGLVAGAGAIVESVAGDSEAAKFMRENHMAEYTK